MIVFEPDGTTRFCGYRMVISGVTDFPCIYGDKVGLGRVYVKLEENKRLNFDSWILGVKDGRSYCGDDRSHLFDLKVNDVELGTKGQGGILNQVNLDTPGKARCKSPLTWQSLSRKR